MCGSCSGEMRLGEFLTATLVLRVLVVEQELRKGSCLQRDIAGLGLAGDELLPRLSALADNVRGVPGVLLARYSRIGDFHRGRRVAHFLFLHSPVKANWFSGFPSGIL